MKWRIQHANTTPYHPECNGAVERMNKTLKQYLQRMSAEVGDRDNWDRLLPKSMFIYNSTVHSSTGFTPYKMQYGTEVRLPGEVQYGAAIRENDTDAASYVDQLIGELAKGYELAREILKGKKEKNEG